MGEIKSALEIALEKTAHIEGDLSSIQNREYRNDGKRLANHFLETGDAEELKNLLTTQLQTGARVSGREPYPFCLPR